jgi:signal peptidase II
MIGRIGVRLAVIATLVATVGCDRVTKHVAANTLSGAPERSFLGDTVRLAYAENTGGFLSLGADLPPLVRTAVFTVATGLLLLALAGLAVRAGWTGWRAFGLSLFLAGGMSNWIDRVLRGSVVDFMNIGVGPLRTGIFNVADVAILAGAAILIVAELRAAAEHAVQSDG